MDKNLKNNNKKSNKNFECDKFSEIILNYVNLTHFTKHLCVRYPKNGGFLLGTRTHDCLYNGLCNILYTKNSKNKDFYINNLMIELDLQKSLIKEAYKQDYFPLEDFKTWSFLYNKLLEILKKYYK